MLPLQQANKVQHSILEYLKAILSFKERVAHVAFYKFIKDGIFNEPYISLKLPIVKVPGVEAIPV